VLGILKELKTYTCSFASTSFLQNGAKVNLFEELIVGFTGHCALRPLSEAAGFRTSTIDQDLEEQGIHATDIEGCNESVSSLKTFRH